MAITYVNDLRLSEMDTGDNSGTWGTVTNTNLELIGEALGYGTEAITTNADTHASEIADGSTDPVRAMYVKYTGTLDSACTITIGPNTVNKFYYIENATSGSQNIIISQGSGANVTIPPGNVKAVYLDGAGSGAAVTDAFASLNVVDLTVQDDLTVTDDVAIGGLATVGETLAVTGVLTADGGIDVDNFHLDGTTLALSSGNLTIDAEAGDIILEGHSNGTVQLHKQGAQYGTIFNGSNDLTIQSVISNNDIAFKGNIGGTDTEVMRIDMSAPAVGILNGAPVGQLHIGAANNSNHEAMITLNNGGASGNEAGIEWHYETNTTPRAKIHVDASDQTLNFSTADAIALSIFSDGSTGTPVGGANNVRFGPDSGDALGAGGIENTMFGSAAGSTLTSSDSCTFVGFKAGFTADGSANTALGYVAYRDATSGTNNIAVGYAAMYDGIVTGSYNIAVGGLSLRNLTSGAQNVALGEGCLGSVDAENNNTAIGDNALLSTTVSELTGVGASAGRLATGTGSTFVGFDSGRFVTSATAGTFIGHSAGKGIDGTKLTGAANTVVGHQAGLVLQGNAYNNTLMGHNAGIAITTGTQNTIVGKGALLECTTSSNNTAVGTSSLAACTGALNVALGITAGLGITSGSGNIAIGYNSCAAAVTGDNNTVVGRQAGGGLTSGYNNVCIGPFAGSANGDMSGETPVATGTNNVLVGAKCQTGAADSDSQVVLGFECTGASNSSLTFGKAATDSNIDMGATSITAPSDQRYKEEITDSTAGLSFINDLRPVTFKWKMEKDVPTNSKAYKAGSETRVMECGDKIMHGFIAQEVKTAIDNHSEIKDGFRMWAEEETGDNRQRVAPGELIPVLTKAVQELSTALDAALARIATLEG